MTRKPTKPKRPAPTPAAKVLEAAARPVEAVRGGVPDRAADGVLSPHAFPTRAASGKGWRCISKSPTKQSAIRRGSIHS